MHRVFLVASLLCVTPTFAVLPPPEGNQLCHRASWIVRAEAVGGSIRVLRQGECAEYEMRVELKIQQVLKGPDLERKQLTYRNAYVVPDQKCVMPGGRFGRDPARSRQALMQSSRKSDIYYLAGESVNELYPVHDFFDPMPNSGRSRNNPVCTVPNEN